MKYGLVVVGILALVFVAAIAYLVALVNSMAQDMVKLREEQNKIYAIVMELKNKTAPIENPILVKISDLVSNPDIYKGRLVAVVGEFHSIVTIPEIKLPYNAVLVDNSSQIGLNVRTMTATIPDGSKVLVIGWLVQGKEKRLEGQTWVDGKTDWYIESLEISRL